MYCEKEFIYMHMSSAQKAQLSMIAIGQYKLYFLIKPRPIKKSAFFFFASLSLSLSFSHLSMTVYFFCTVLSFFSLSLSQPQSDSPSSFSAPRRISDRLFC